MTQTEEEIVKEQEVPAMSLEQMKTICDAATDFLVESKAYLRPDISLAVFAKEMNVSSKTLSKCINGYLKINFFEFINRMRVEEAKQRLADLETSGYNIDSIYGDCGFRSRSSFFMVFKKIEPARRLPVFRPPSRSTIPMRMPTALRSRSST